MHGHDHQSRWQLKQADLRVPTLGRLIIVTDQRDEIAGSDRSTVNASKRTLMRLMNQDIYPSFGHVSMPPHKVTSLCC